MSSLSIDTSNDNYNINNNSELSGSLLKRKDFLGVGMSKYYNNNNNYNNNVIIFYYCY